MADIISIGSDHGDPDSEFIGSLKTLLVQTLRKHVTSSHCPAIDTYSLVLRVDGRFAQFGQEGLAKLRFAKARRYITLDIQVPETTWRILNQQETRHYLVRQVNTALETCVERLERDGHPVHKQLLASQVSMAFHEYLAHNQSAA